MAKLNERLTKMVDDAIRHIDSLSIDELEREFRSFGLEVIRKKTLVEQTKQDILNEIKELK